MKSEKRFVGVDLGAGSGRVMLGLLADGRLRIEEVHRFENDPVRVQGTLYWDLMGLLRNAERGIAEAARRVGGEIHGIGVDTWGVDFGLLDRAGGILAPPVHYRDQRTEGLMDEVFAKIPRAEVFDETGIQFMPFNTLYQVAAVKKRTPEVLDAAGTMLLMADLLHYHLTGRAVAELTLTTTSQMWNPRTNAWSGRIADALGIPTHIFPEVVQPGTTLGPLREDIARDSGVAGRPPVIATASHDTGSAIAAVPYGGTGSWAYLSSGTWSLLGVELPAPKIGPEALAHNFTNEGGIAGTSRFLKNINGLWLLQECRRRWMRDGQDIDHSRIVSMAEESGSAESFILPGAPEFFAPADMPEAIRSFCRSTGQKAPETKGAIARTALESLALAYRDVIEEIETVTASKVDVLHIVGGGVRNELLNQLAADACGVPVLAGPVEATVMGNILIQAMGTGDVGSVAELRAIVRDSVDLLEYQPRERQAWADKVARYRGLQDGRASSP